MKIHKEIGEAKSNMREAQRMIVYVLETLYSNAHSKRSFPAGPLMSFIQ